MGECDKLSHLSTATRFNKSLKSREEWCGEVTEIGHNQPPNANQQKKGDGRTKKDYSPFELGHTTSIRKVKT